MKPVRTIQSSIIKAIASLAMLSSLNSQDSALPERTEATIASRLASAQFVGLEADEKMAGIALHVYTPELQKRNQERLAKFQEGLKEFEQNLAALDAQLENARKERASQQILDAISVKRNALFATRPFSIFEKTIQLYRVVSVGKDFIELEQVENSSGTTLIPFHRLSRVVIPKADTEVEPNSKSESFDDDTNVKTNRVTCRAIYSSYKKYHSWFEYNDGDVSHGTSPLASFQILEPAEYADRTLGILYSYASSGRAALPPDQGDIGQQFSFDVPDDFFSGNFATIDNIEIRHFRKFDR